VREFKNKKAALPAGHLCRGNAAFALKPACLPGSQIKP